MPIPDPHVDPVTVEPGTVEPGTVALATWGSDRLPDVAALWAADSTEPLPERDLARTLGAGEGTVLATPDGGGVVAVVVRQRPDGPVGYVRLLAVAPDRRRRGVARSLLTAAETWLRGQGAGEIRLGGEAPRYLWPGVDARNLAMQALALSAGYRPVGCALNLSLPTAYRADAPRGVRVRRARADDVAVADSLRALVDGEWPAWAVEVDLALADGTVFVAVPEGDPGTVTAFCAHSTLRSGWIGPMGTAATHRGRGLAAAVLSAVCADLSAAGLEAAEVAWVGPVGLFADRGAVTSRVFRSYAKSV